MHHRHCIYLTFLASFSILFSCSRDHTETDELKSVLHDYYHNDMVESCTFTITGFPALFGKPEFQVFQNKRLCEGKIIIHGVHHREPDTLEAKIRFVFQSNERILRDLAKAWDGLEKRYRTLKPELVPHWSGKSVYVYVDPSDGETFVSGQDKPGDIFETVQWQHLEELKAFFTSKLKEREWETDIVTVTLTRENGRWKIINDETAGHTTQGTRR